MNRTTNPALDSYTSQELIDAVLARKEPDTAKALFSLAGTYHPAFVEEWRSTSVQVLDVVDDLYEVMEWLREDKLFSQSDRVRTLTGRLARTVPPHRVFGGWEKKLIRNLARDFPEQLSLKESKKLIARNKALEAAIKESKL